MINELLLILKSFGNLLAISLKWLFSGDSSGILTLITGVIAILVYMHQLKTRRQNAAKILYMEIRDSEIVIDRIKSGQDLLSLEIQVMPVQSWTQYRSLLANKLDRDTQDHINTFYSKCSAADKTLNLLRSFLLDVAMKRKAELFQEKLSEFAAAEDDYIKNKKLYLEKFEPEDYWFLPKKAKDDLLNYLSGITQVTNTPAGEKLRKIAGL